MPDREKYIDIFKQIVKEKKKYYRNDNEISIRISYQCVVDILALLKEQKKQKFFVDENGKITPLPDVVRCKDCLHRGKSEKCVLAAISEEKNFPLFMLDNRGEWFCADGKKEGR